MGRRAPETGSGGDKESESPPLAAQGAEKKEKAAAAALSKVLKPASAVQGAETTGAALQGAENATSAVPKVLKKKKTPAALQKKRGYHYFIKQLVHTHALSRAKPVPFTG